MHQRGGRGWRFSKGTEWKVVLGRKGVLGAQGLVRGRKERDRKGREREAGETEAEASGGRRQCLVSP